MSRSRLFRLAAVALLLLSLPALLPPAQAQTRTPCIAYDICETCTATTSRHCFIVRCNGQTTKNCGACVTDCVAGL
jgi:ferredoxin